MFAPVGAGSSLTAVSGNHSENTSRLLAQKAFYKNDPLSIPPFNFETHGRIQPSRLDDLLEQFEIPGKNKKYFDPASTGLFYCVSLLRNVIKDCPGRRLGLYVNTGPANAELDDFSLWGSENRRSDNGEPYTKMMASSVVRILPNIVMSNLSINLDILGENTLLAGTCASSARTLDMAAQVIDTGRCEAVVVASSSFPYRFFNLDAYSRFFSSDFFAPPLVEAASAVLLLAPGSDVLKTTTGAITGITYLRAAPELDLPEQLRRAGFEADDYDEVIYSPSDSGNFLSAAEPLGTTAVLAALERRSPGGRGLSVSVDYFGNISVVQLVGPLKALSWLKQHGYTGWKSFPDLARKERGQEPESR